MKKTDDALRTVGGSLPIRAVRVHAARSVRGIAAPCAVLCVLAVIALGIALLLRGWRAPVPEQGDGAQRTDNAYYLALSQNAEKGEEEHVPVLGDSAFSRNVILVDMTEDRVLCVKAPDEIAYPASLTKMMTVLVAIEHTDNLSLTYTLEQDIFDYLIAENASTAGFLSGEEVTLIDLMYTAILPSGSEAAIGLARFVSGDELSFVALMNEKARQIGMTSTHFTNVTGLHSDAQVTTARDMSLLLRCALKNDRFRTILTTTRYATHATNLHPHGFTVYSTVYTAFRQGEREMGDLKGGKTGYTPEAGQCLASYTVRDGHEYALVTMGAGNGTNATPYHVFDAESILDLYAGVK